MRKTALVAVAVWITISGTAFCWDRTTNRNVIGSLGGSEREIEIKEKYNYNPSSTYKGSIDSYGNVRTRNWQGDQLKGNVDDNGYGRLQDSSGNFYRVRPR